MVLRSLEAGGGRVLVVRFIRNNPSYEVVLRRDFLPFNNSFFLSPTTLYLTRLGVEGYYSFDHTQWQATGGRTPLDEGSARRRDLYLTRHNTHNGQPSMPRWDSNPQSQQAIGCRHTPKTAWPLGSAPIIIIIVVVVIARHIIRIMFGKVNII
jgi:hypothetical protein